MQYKILYHHEYKSEYRKFEGIIDQFSWVSLLLITFEIPSIYTSKHQIMLKYAKIFFFQFQLILHIVVR